jgi:hypothetical protein
VQVQTVERAVEVGAGGLAGGKLLDHVEVVLLYLAPGAGYYLPLMHHKHVLTWLRAEDLGEAFVEDVNLGDSGVKVFTAEVTGVGVNAVNKLEGGEARL